MDWEGHRALMLEHCLRLRSLEPTYARWATAKYAKLPHLQGFEEEVKAEWSRRNPDNPSW